MRQNTSVLFKELFVQSNVKVANQEPILTDSNRELVAVPECLVTILEGLPKCKLPPVVGKAYIVVLITKWPHL